MNQGPPFKSDGERLFMFGLYHGLLGFLFFGFWSTIILRRVLAGVIPSDGDPWVIDGFGAALGAAITYIVARRTMPKYFNSKSAP